eukprot:948915-Amphidinium_carterae.1
MQNVAFWFSLQEKTSACDLWDLLQGGHTSVCLVIVSKASRARHCYLGKQRHSALNYGLHDVRCYAMQ